MGDVLRAAHRARNFEHHEQGRQGKDVAERVEAAVLESEPYRHHEQLCRLHEQVGDEQRSPQLGEVRGLGQDEQQCGEGRGDRQDDQHRVANDVSDC